MVCCIMIWYVKVMYSMFIMIWYDDAHTMSAQWHISRTRRNELDAVHAGNSPSSSCKSKHLSHLQKSSGCQSIFHLVMKICHISYNTLNTKKKCAVYQSWPTEIIRIILTKWEHWPSIKCSFQKWNGAGARGCKFYQMRRPFDICSLVNRFVGKVWTLGWNWR